MSFLSDLKANLTAARLPTVTFTGGVPTGIQFRGTAISTAGSSAAGDAGFSFRSVFDTRVLTTNPGSTKCNFDATNVTFVINETSVGGESLDGFFGTVLRGQLRFRSTNSASLAWGLFNVTSATNDGVHWRFGGTLENVGGSLPALNEEIQITYVQVATDTDVVELAKEAFFVRYDVNKQLLDKDGVIFSGTTEVADMTALLALDVAAYKNYVVVVDGLGGKPAFKSNGTTWLPLNGSYSPGSSNLSVKKVICANQVTWAASNNGGFVRLTGTAHGLTAAANGYSLYLTNTLTNWAAGSFHQITFVDANILDTTTAWVTGMGTVPTFAVANSTVIPVLALTIPPLRINSRYVVDLSIRGQTNASVTTNRIYAALGAVDITQVTYSAAANETFPMKTGFMNQNSASVQRGMYGKSSSGSASGSDYIAHALDTSTGTQVYTIYLYCHIVNFGLELASYSIEVRN